MVLPCALSRHQLGLESPLCVGLLSLTPKLMPVTNRANHWANIQLVQLLTICRLSASDSGLASEQSASGAASTFCMLADTLPCLAPSSGERTRMDQLPQPRMMAMLNTWRAAQTGSQPAEDQSVASHSLGQASSECAPQSRAHKAGKPQLKLRCALELCWTLLGRRKRPSRI